MPQEVRDNGISVKKYINDCLNSSLNNLGVEYIDLYIYHCYDEKMPIEEIMETLNEAVMAGKVKYIGISNCFAWQIAKANYIAEKHGWAKFISVQGHYNLLFVAITTSSLLAKSFNALPRYCSLVPPAYASA